MKYLDKVRVLVDKKSYETEGVHKGMIGTIADAEIRNNCFHVGFIDPKFYNQSFEWTDESMITIKDDIFCPIQIEDLELIEDSHCSNECLLNALPQNNPCWWCKVEDGYILNLKGERKNKIPYNFKS